MRSRKKFISLLFTLFLTTSMFLNVSIANENNEIKKIEKMYFFEKPTISNITINGKIFDRIIMNEASDYGDIGSPILPFYNVQLLLPFGTGVSSIFAEPGKEISLSTGYNIEPFLEPVKLSEINKISTKKQTYDTNYLDTRIILETIGTYNFRGYSIFTFNLYPANYYSTNKELTYFENIKVVINLTNDGYANALFRGKQIDEDEASKKIDNVEVISTYKQNIAPLNTDDYNLLIITTNSFRDGFLPLKNMHDSKGIKTEIKTINEINGYNGGSDTPEVLRDFIRYEYINHGIEYVLIGGDHDIIPSKMLWVQAESGGDETTMPVDMYYGCLDGPFNFDGDDKWGERTDGYNGTDVDLIAEVYVGRAPVGDSDEVNNFVSKSLKQMELNYSEGNVLLVGELLWTPPDTYGDDYMDQLVDICKKNMYTTNGIPSDIYTIEKLYDRNYPEHNWPVADLINLINNGVKMINHLGHSNYDYNMRMTNEDVSLLTNDEPFFLYSQGCMAGGFDDPYGYDCIAEYFTVKSEHAAFAAIMCARFGWGVIGGTDGASQKYHRQFVDAIFGEQIPEIGKANHDSKEDNIKYINRQCMRWCYYETNLLGDPTLKFYNLENNAPNKPETPVGVNNGKVGLKYNISTLTYDSDSDKIYYKFEWGDETVSKWQGPYESGENVIISHLYEKRGIYQIKVRARDTHYAISPWSDPLIVIIIKNRGIEPNFFEILKTRFPKIINLLELIL